jgi:competence protein ComEC
MILRFWFILFSIFIIVSTASFLFFKDEPEVLGKVYVLDIGQGDAILVELPNKQRWLIDGGPDNSVVAELQKTMPFADRNLTGIILTHPHADHVSGLVNVLNQFQVGYVLMTPTVHTSPVYKNFLDTVQSSGVEAIPMTEPFVWQGENWQWQFLYPISDTEVDNLNDTSIVSKLMIGEYSFLFMGDAEAEVEKLLVQQRDLRAHVLKVGHHGSDTSSTEDFLNEVAPQHAIISVGENNRFNHPSESVIKRLQDYNAAIWRTDHDGRIVVTIDELGLNVAKE